MSCSGGAGADGFLAETKLGFSGGGPRREPIAGKVPLRLKESVMVRTLRPHDTVDGQRAPGDEYKRSPADAKQLAQAGVVAIVETKKPAAKRRARKSN